MSGCIANANREGNAIAQFPGEWRRPEIVSLKSPLALVVVWKWPLTG
jgi:hypothetical protein